MGGDLELVRQGRQIGRRPSAPLQGEGDQAVREPGVLWKKRTVEVGADHVQSFDPFVAVAIVVPVAVEYPPELYVDTREERHAAAHDR